MAGTADTLRLLLLLMTVWQVSTLTCDIYIIRTHSTTDFATPYFASSTFDCQAGCTSFTNCYAYAWNTTLSGSFQCFHIYRPIISTTFTPDKTLAIRNCRNCTTDVDIGFILDGSGSIRLSNWNLMLQFVANIIDQLPTTSARVGAVVFSDDAVLLFSLNRHIDLQDARAAILTAPYPGSATNTSGGLYRARVDLFNISNGDRQNVPDLAIILTDGMSNVDSTLTIPMAQALHRIGVVCLPIGITNSIDETELSGISSPPQQRGVSYFISPDFQQLQGFLGNITAIACDFTTPRPSTTTPPRTTTPTPTTAPTTRPTTSIQTTFSPFFTTTSVPCPPDEGLGTDLVVIIACFSALGGILLGMLLAIKCCPVGKAGGWFSRSYPSGCNACTPSHPMSSVPSCKTCSPSCTISSVQGCSNCPLPRWSYALHMKPGPMVGPLPSYSCNGAMSYPNSYDYTCSHGY